LRNDSFACPVVFDRRVKVNLQTTSNGKRPIAGAMALFVVWTAVTWLLEGRIEIFLRPEAVKDRLVYAIVANVAIGIVGAAAVVRWLAGLGLAREAAGSVRHFVPGAAWRPEQ
jgi:hypothetical protein